MQRFAPLACVLLLGACSTSTALTASQVNEKAMIEANDLYAAIATACNAYATAQPDQADKAMAVETRAWADLMAVREIYAAGQTVLLTALQADETTASAVTGATISTPAS